jgi:UDPglucose 6-dehydrogenase
MSRVAFDERESGAGERTTACPEGSLAMTRAHPRALPAARIERIGFVGYGYVGRATARAFSSVADVAYADPAMPGGRGLADLLSWSDAIFVCVPTPMEASGAADLRIVHDVMAQLATDVEVPVLLKSTVPPGTGAQLSRRWPNLPLVLNPEFLRERHHLEDALSPARIVLGWTDGIDDARRACVLDLYARRFPDAPVMEVTAMEAELIKYASNALLGVKVSFANELAELARRLGTNWEPIRQALILDPRVGDSHLSVPGPDGRPGFGGACLPKDMASLLRVATDAGIELDVVAAALSGNERRRPV